MRTRFAFTALAGALALAATATQAQNQAPLKVGFMLPATGTFAALGDMIELHVQLTVLAARHAARRADAAQLAQITQFVGLMTHVAEDGVPADEFQHLRVGFARALFGAAGGALAERLPSAAPVTPHHARAMADVETREGQMEVARLARDVLIAIEAKAPDVAAIGAERMLRRHAERTVPALARRELA